MSTDIPSIEPETITAGDTVKWTKSLDCYKPEDSWVLTYYLVNTSIQVIITTSDNGDSTHLVNLAKATTAAYTVGTYDFKGFVDNGTERYEIFNSKMEILPDLVAATSGTDTRTHSKTMLDAIEANLENRASKEEEEYTIEGRSLKRLTFEALTEARDYYESRVLQEQAKEDRDAGKGNKKLVLTRFTRK